MNKENHMTYEDYKKIMGIISETKTENNIQAFRNIQEKLERLYPEYNTQYRYWLYEQIEKGI